MIGDSKYETEVCSERIAAKFSSWRDSHRVASPHYLGNEETLPPFSQGSGLDGERRCPLCIYVHSERMQPEHLVVEFESRPSRLDESLEVANVLAYLLDDSRMVFVPGLLRPAITCEASATRLYRARQSIRFASANQFRTAIDVRRFIGVSGERPIDGWHRWSIRVVVSLCPASSTTKSRALGLINNAVRLNTTPRTTSSRWFSRGRCDR